MGNKTNQAGEAEVVEIQDASVDDVVAEAVTSVDAEDAGAEEKEAVTAPVEKEVTAEVPDVIDTEDQSAEEKEVSGETEEGEEASLENIMVDEKPKGEIEGAKDGTPDWLQKRIDKQTKRNNEALEEKDKVIADLKTKVIPEKRPPVPLLEDFETREAFNDAYLAWKDQDDDWKASKKDKTARETAANDKLSRNVQRYEASSERMTAKYPDNDKGTGFNQVVNKNTFYGHLSEAILTTEFQGEISYNLGMYPEKLKALLKKDFIEAVIEIGEMSGRCKASKTKTLSSAPKVLKIVKESEGGGDGDDADFSTAEIDKMSKSILRTA